MVDHARARKLAVRIREIVASALRTQVKDPRLGMVTVTDVRVTPDLRDATVYYTVLGDPVEQQATAIALGSATGVLRSMVGRQTGVKFTPSLAFVQDAIPVNAKHIDDLLAQAREADEQVRSTAVGAQPAGDPDPYRHPVDDADDTDDTRPDDGPDTDGDVRPGGSGSTVDVTAGRRS